MKAELTNASTTSSLPRSLAKSSMGEAAPRYAPCCAGQLSAKERELDARVAATTRTNGTSTTAGGDHIIELQHDIEQRSRANHTVPPASALLAQQQALLEQHNQEEA